MCRKTKVLRCILDKIDIPASVRMGVLCCPHILSQFKNTRGFLKRQNFQLFLQASVHFHPCISIRAFLCIQICPKPFSIKYFFYSSVSLQIKWEYDIMPIGEEMM